MKHLINKTKLSIQDVHPIISYNFKLYGKTEKLFFRPNLERSNEVYSDRRSSSEERTKEPVSVFWRGHKSSCWSVRMMDQHGSHCWWEDWTATKHLLTERDILIILTLDSVFVSSIVPCGAAPVRLPPPSRCCWHRWHVVFQLGEKHTLHLCRRNRTKGKTSPCRTQEGHLGTSRAGRSAEGWGFSVSSLPPLPATLSPTFSPSPCPSPSSPVQPEVANISTFEAEGSCFTFGTSLSFSLAPANATDGCSYFFSFLFFFFHFFPQLETWQMKGCLYVSEK